MFTRPSSKPIRIATGVLSFCFVLSPGVGQLSWAQSLVDTPFTRQVEKNFTHWDKDKNGTLSELEVNASITDPRFTGESAAALAALKVALRSTKRGPLPPFDRPYFAQYAHRSTPRKSAAISAAPVGEIDEVESSPETSAPPPFDSYYQRSLSRLRTTGPEIFLSNDPRLDHIRQHSENDCFFLAVIGAIINRDPAALHNMVTTGRDGSSLVTFPGRQPQTIPSLTDAQICLYGSTSSGVRWLMLLEEAFSRTNNERRPESARQEVSSDFYTVGGSTPACMRILTGHATDGITLRARDAITMPTQEEMGPKLPPLRTALIDAFREHRIVTVGTNNGVMPPAVTPRHAYAVLGYVAASDTIRLWNPHRNNTRHRGAPGLQTGYPTREGIFTLPLAEFACIFMRVTWEVMPGKEISR